MTDQVPFIADEDFVIQEPRTVSAGRGLAWVTEGFEYFKEFPGQWLLLALMYFIAMAILSSIPVVNWVSDVLMYVLLGGILLGCKDQFDGKPFSAQCLFAGFKNKFLPLLALGGVLVGATFTVFFVCLGGSFYSLITHADFDQVQLIKILLGVCIALILLMPLYMALWFAPCLIVFGDYSVWHAIKASFKAGLKNIWSLTFYGVVLLLALIVAIIPLGLGLFVLLPVLFASFFISFKEIFVD